MQAKIKLTSSSTWEAEIYTHYRCGQAHGSLIAGKVIVEDLYIEKQERGKGAATAFLSLLSSHFSQPVFPFCPLDDASVFWNKWIERQGLPAPDY